MRILNAIISKHIIIFLLFAVPNLSIAQTYIGGHFSTDTTLSISGNPYIVESNLYIDENFTLTLLPGTILKFDTRTSLTINGTLTAEGTSTDSIIFTSWKDDSYAGDSNADGDATSPAAGNWHTIQFNAGSDNSSLSHCVLQYGGEWIGG
ncbi:hypothetical protein HQ531_02525, partial [bacterium]|nr:hypothetical protein [bacterium]